jgi:hypothetical protein
MKWQSSLLDQQTTTRVISKQALLQPVQVYISTIEAKDYPIVGLQWHPEKNSYEWSRHTDIPHGYLATEVTHQVRAEPVQRPKCAARPGAAVHPIAKPAVVYNPGHDTAPKCIACGESGLSCHVTPPYPLVCSHPLPSPFALSTPSQPQPGHIHIP